MAFDNLFLQHITSIRLLNYYTSLFIAVFCGDEYSSFYCLQAPGQTISAVTLVQI